MKKITLLTLFLIATLTSLAQSNANCSGATPLSSGVTVTGSSNSGSHSGIYPSCGFADKDYWYSFVAPISGEVSVSTSEEYAVYTTCPADNDDVSDKQIFCGNGNNTISSLNSGETYYIQVMPLPIACKGSACGDFNITVTENALSNNTIENSLFNAYPNPVQDILSVKSKSKITSIQVYNVLGKALLIRTPNTLNTELDLSSFSNGYYLLRINSGSKSKMLKVLKN